MEVLSAFIEHYRQPLLYLYLAALLAAVVAFVLAVQRGSRELGSERDRGARLDWRAGIPPGLAIPIGALSLLLVVPWYVDNLGRYGAFLQRAPGVIFFVFLFTAGGVLLVVHGLRGWMRVGDSGRELHLEEVSLRPDGLVSGRYRITGSRGGKEPVRVHLVLQQSRLTRWGRGHREVVEHALWAATQEVRPRRRGEGCEIPFLFHLPQRLPPLRKGAGRPEWVLVREGGGLHKGLHLVQAGEACVAAWQSPPVGEKAPETPLPSASALASRPTPGGLGELLQLAFVGVFPWAFWFGMDSDRQPWHHLREQLPSILLQGAIILCLFFTAVFALICWALKGEEGGARWRRLLSLALAGDVLIAMAGLFHLSRHGLPTVEGPWLDLVMEFLSGTVLHGFIGMFLWIGIWAWAALFWSLLRRLFSPSRHR